MHITHNIDFHTIDTLKINNYRKITNSIISGGTFSIKQKEDLIKLHNAGIDNIIDFRAEATDIFQQTCKKEGFKYLSFPLDALLHPTKSNYFTLQKDGKKTVSPLFLCKLKEFMNLTENGNTYMGCQYGIDRTNIGVLMKYLFSKDNVPTPEILNWPEQSKKSVMNQCFRIIKKITKGLTPEQKKELQLPDNLNDYVFMKYQKVLFKNRVTNI